MRYIYLAINYIIFYLVKYITDDFTKQWVTVTPNL